MYCYVHQKRSRISPYPSEGMHLVSLVSLVSWYPDPWVHQLIQVDLQPFSTYIKSATHELEIILAKLMKNIYKGIVDYCKF